MKGQWIIYSPEELAWLEEHATMMIRDYHAAFVARFARSDVSASNLHALRKRKGWRTGRTGQFVKDQVPHNLGKKCAPGSGGLHPNARRTQFRKGNLPHNTKWLGHERIDVYGYIEINVDQPNPYTGFGRRYVKKHRWLWEQQNGPLPAGHALKCLDANKQNTDPSNWKAIPRAVLARLNGGRHKKRVPYDDAAPDLRPTLMVIAELEQRVQDVRKGGKRR